MDTVNNDNPQVDDDLITGDVETQMDFNGLTLWSKRSKK